MKPPSPAGRMAPSDRIGPFRLLFPVAVLAAAFLHFWIHTTPVRLATPDDVEFQAVVDQGNATEYLATHAREQGRFLYCTPIYRFALFSFYEVRDAPVFSLLRTTALFAQIALTAWLTARVLQSAALGTALALLLAGTLHIPITYYLVLSFPPIWIGFSAVLGALHCHYTYLHRPGFLSGLMAGLLFLLALMMHDVFVIFLPLFIGLSVLQGKLLWRSLLSRNIIPLAVAFAYVAVHRRFAAEFPSSYAGTQFSWDLLLATKVLLRQLIGVIPGFELFVNRVSAETTSPLWRELPAVIGTLGLLTWFDLLLALGLALAVADTFQTGLMEPSPHAGLWPWALGFACLANLPIALSAKYQVFILHREFPYEYAWFSYFFLGIATVSILAWRGQRIPAGRNRRLLVVTVGTMTFLLCLSALASNHRVLHFLQERLN